MINQLVDKLNSNMDNGYLKSMIETFETELHRKNNMILTLLNINTCTSNNDLKEECNVDKINVSLQPIPINIDTPISANRHFDLTYPIKVEVF